jgi:hypothetical protein
MIKIKNRDNLYFEGMDPWETHLSKRKLERLKNSWAEIFRRYVLHQLPIKQLKKYYSKTQGRPTKELIAMAGTCVLQQIFDFTDEETRDQLAFNQQWHYALDLLAADDQDICLKTLWTCRHLLVTDKAAKITFDAVVNQLADAYKVDLTFQRLDSVHIHSNMSRLGRIRLLSRVISNFLKNLKRHHTELYTTISASIISRYTKNDDDPDYFGNARPSESQKRLEDMAPDLYEIIHQFKGNTAIESMHTYLLLLRVFNEQCDVENERVAIKPAKDVRSDSLQNPSDVDASYDGHKGQGYQVQIMETYSKQQATGDTNQPSLQLITYVNVEPAHCHDSDAVEPALEDTKQRHLLPAELEADTLYGSASNVKKANDHDVHLVAPTPGKKPDHNLTSFSFDETTHQITYCPAGHAPTAIKRNTKGSIRCCWNLDLCYACEFRSQCCVKQSPARRDYQLRYTPKEADSAIRRQYEQSADFKDKYRYRSGIEASISRYIHMTGARRLRYRGQERVSYAAQLKAVGINLFRAARFVLEREHSACLA